MLTKLTDAYILTKAANTFWDLLALDNLWTQAILDSKSRSAGQIETLELLSHEVQELFLTAAEKARWAAEFIAHHREQFERLCVEGFAEMEFNDEQKSAFRELAGRHGGFSGLAEHSLKEIIRLFPEERAQNRREMDVAIKGGNPHGDMSQRAKCALLTFSTCVFIACQAVPLAAASFAGFLGYGCLDQ